VLLVVTGGMLIAKPSFLFGGMSTEGSDVGYLIAFFGIFCFGSLFYFAKKATEYGDDVCFEMLFVYNIIAMIMSVLFSLILPDSSFIMPGTYQELLAMLFVGFCGLCTQGSYNYGSQHLDIGIVSVISVTEGMWAFVWQIMLFGQHSDWISYTGAGIVTLCIALIILLKDPHTRSPATTSIQPTAALILDVPVPSPLVIAATGSETARLQCEKPISDYGSITAGADDNDEHDEGDRIEAKFPEDIRLN